MKHKASLTLMELLVMVLVFSMTAALCLQGFTYAANTSRMIGQQDLAVRLARNEAERLKAGHGTAEKTDVRYYNETGDPCGEEEAVYCMEIIPVSAAVPGLGQAKICVLLRETQTQLFSLDVCWQEVGK